MGRKAFKKTVAAVALLGMVSGTAFVLGSCGNETANDNTESSITCSVADQGESLVETMTRIYTNIYGDTVVFESAKIVEQDNGFVVAIATAEIENGFYLNFGALVERHGDTLIVCDTPEKTKDCKSDCEKCMPVLNGNGWDCYGCEGFGCETQNGGTIPGGGGPPQN